MLCVGLDPDISRMPEGYGTSPAEIERFCIEIVKATAEFACAFKPQIAYFAANRAEAALENILAYANEIAPHATTILDAKRGDIGATAKQYAIEAFERYKADSVTLSPYMGSDSVEPYHAYSDRGLFLLCRTSNPGGNDLQFLNTEKANRFIKQSPSWPLPLGTRTARLAWLWVPPTPKRSKRCAESLAIRPCWCLALAHKVAIC